MSDIKVKSRFGRFYEMNYEQALQFAKKKLSAITMGKGSEERLIMVNSCFVGIQFTLDQLKN